jgi:hypothetical protein
MLASQDDTNTRQFVLSRFAEPETGNSIPESIHEHFPFPPSYVSSRCSNLSRSLSPEHADESAGVYGGDLLLAPLRIAYSFHVIYI